MIVYVESNFVLELAYLQEEHEYCLTLGVGGISRYSLGTARLLHWGTVRSLGTPIQAQTRVAETNG